MTDSWLVSLYSNSPWILQTIKVKSWKTVFQVQLFNTPKTFKVTLVLDDEDMIQLICAYSELTWRIEIKLTD